MTMVAMVDRVRSWVEITIISLGDHKNQKAKTHLLWYYMGLTSWIIVENERKGSG